MRQWVKTLRLVTNITLFLKDYGSSRRYHFAFLFGFTYIMGNKLMMGLQKWDNYILNTFWTFSAHTYTCLCVEPIQFTVTYEVSIVFFITNLPCGFACLYVHLIILKTGLKYWAFIPSIYIVLVSIRLPEFNMSSIIFQAYPHMFQQVCWEKVLLLIPLIWSSLIKWTTKCRGHFSKWLFLSSMTWYLPVPCWNIWSVLAFYFPKGTRILN